MSVDKKRQLRRIMRQLRRDAVTTVLTKMVNDRLFEWLCTQDILSVGFYRPMVGEICLDDALVHWQRYCGAKLSVPVVDDIRQGLMHFHLWDPCARMREGAFGIQEPERTEPVVPELVIAPCVGFDVRGFRLGNGGGFYDRYLQANPGIRTLLVAAQIQCLGNFGVAPHDIAFETVLTEKGIFVPIG